MKNLDKLSLIFNRFDPDNPPKHLSNVVYLNTLGGRQAELVEGHIEYYWDDNDGGSISYKVRNKTPKNHILKFSFCSISNHSVEMDENDYYIPTKDLWKEIDRTHK